MSKILFKELSFIERKPSPLKKILARLFGQRLFGYDAHSGGLTITTSYKLGKSVYITNVEYIERSICRNCKYWAKSKKKILALSDRKYNCVNKNSTFHRQATASNWICGDWEK